RLLLSLALCSALVTSTVSGNAHASNWPCRRHPRIASSPFPIGRRGKELAQKADCRVDPATARDHAGHVYAFSRIRTVESADERLERRAGADALPSPHHGAPAARRARFSGEAVPELPLPGSQRRTERSGARYRGGAAYAR